MATPKYLLCNLNDNQQPYETFIPAACKQCDSLPISNPSALDFYPVDGTPLALFQRFAPGLGLDSVYTKEEHYAPISSFKDRQAADAVVATLENGIKEAVYQKGSLLTQKFVNQVINVIEEANERQGQGSEK